MNFKITLATFLLLLALSLIAFGFSLIGVAGSVINSIWKLVALSIGISLVTGFAFPFIRGVRKGDVLATATHYGVQGQNVISSLFTGVGAVAMQNGRKGDKIKINFQGRHAEGIVISYASTFSPAVVKVTEMEQISPATFRM